MAQKLIKLFKEEKFTDLSGKLKDSAIIDLCGFADDHVLRGKSGDDDEPTTILQAVFKGCSLDKSHLSSHALAVFLHCLKLLASPDVSDGIGTNIIGILLLETDRLSSGGLVDVTKVLTDMVRTGNSGCGRALHVLPKILMCIEQKREIHLGSGQGTMSGLEYKKHLINTLCSGKWSSKSIIHLANIFKNVPMLQEEMGFFLQKMLRQLDRVDVQEIPPLVHQVLPLGGRAHHETVLRGLFALFNCLDSKVVQTKKKPPDDASYWDEMFEIDVEASEKPEGTDSRDLHLVEGTVLLHLTNMARWDQSLGKAFIKMLKTAKDALSEDILSEFFLAFALSLAQIKCFQDEVLTQLKAIVFRCFRHDHQQVRSNWLKQRGLSCPNIEKALLSVVGACGWDQVVTGIVCLGFSLMDAYGPKSGAFGRQIEGDVVRKDTPRQKSCDVGGSLLAGVFKAHPAVRTEIVERILNRVITNNSSPINHYIDVLKGIAKRYPTTLLESKHKLREFFDHLCLLSPQNTDCVLQAILPLLKINSSLKDSLILVLKKALFSCQLNGRIIACNGFLLLLRSFKVAGYVSLSQASSQCSQSIFFLNSQIAVDVHSSSQEASCTQGANHEPLCLEILSTLRRCLTQQAPVRASLYKGLWNVVTHNPHLAGPILENLLGQLGRYYEENEGMLPPLKTDCCVVMQNGEPTLLEPLPLLMSSLFSCLRKAQEASRIEEDEDDIVDESLVVKINEIFGSLTRRMAKSEMEDFELDKSADFSTTTSVGKKNCILSGVVIGCYETLIEYNYLQEDFTEECANHVLELHQSYKKMKDVVHGGRKDAGKSLAGLSVLNGIESPIFMKSMIDGLFCDESPDREAGLNILRESEDFVKYMLDITAHGVACARDHGLVKGIAGNSKSVVQEFCMTVGRACLRKFMQEKNNSSSSQIAYSSIDVFHTCLQYFMTRKKKRLEEFLTSALEAEGGDIPSTSLDIRAKHIHKFQRIIISYVSEDVDLSSSHRKILPVLVSIMDSLSSMPSAADGVAAAPDRPRHSSTPFPPAINQLNEWVAKLCNEQIIDDAATTKCLIDLHFKLSSACGPWTGTDRASQGSEGAIRDVAKDIHHVAGDVEQGEEETRMTGDRKRGSNYSIVDECNVIQIVPLIVNHVDLAVDETDWLLQRLKGQVSALLTGDKSKGSAETENEHESVFQEKRQKIESAMCVRLGILLIAYRELIQAALPLGTPAESALRGLTRLFTLLATFTKYYTFLVAQSVIKFPPERFAKLIKLCGSEVTCNVYPFINYLESVQSSHMANAARKRKRKDAEKENAGTSMEKSRVLRETRAIPPLIYAIENMERFLISLGRKCKMDLLSGHKLPTSRDFRIKSAIIKEALARNEESVNSEADETESRTDVADDDASSDSETATKRTRADEAYE